MNVLVKKISEHAKIPSYAHATDSGMDLFADHDAEILPGEIKIIGTGIQIELPKELEAQVRPKSGLALNHGITVLNAPGTIDAGYRGEIKVILINHGKEKFVIEKGKKIAQMVFQKIERPELKIVNELNESSRNEDGFGSTGLR